MLYLFEFTATRRTTEIELTMAVHNPTEHHQRAFKTGWRTALRVRNGERAEYRDPEKNTWMAIGYRHGRRLETDDDSAISEAFDWSLIELRQHDHVDVRLFRERG
jgi:hypothetical protein